VVRHGAQRRADVYGTLDASPALFAGVSGARWNSLYFHPGARGTLVHLHIEDAESGTAPVVHEGTHEEVRWSALKSQSRGLRPLGEVRRRIRRAVGRPLFPPRSTRHADGPRH